MTAEVRQCPQCLELYPANLTYFRRIRKWLSRKCRACKRLEERLDYHAEAARQGKITRTYRPGPFDRTAYNRSWRAANQALIQSKQTEYRTARKRAKFKRILGGGE